MPLSLSLGMPGQHEFTCTFHWESTSCLLGPRDCLAIQVQVQTRVEFEEGLTKPTEHIEHTGHTKYARHTFFKSLLRASPISKVTHVLSDHTVARTNEVTAPLLTIALTIASPPSPHPPHLSLASSEVNAQGSFCVTCSSLSLSLVDFATEPKIRFGHRSNF